MVIIIDTLDKNMFEANIKVVNHILIIKLKPEKALLETQYEQ